MGCDTKPDPILLTATQFENQVTDKHLKGLRAFKEEGCVKSYVAVSLNPEYRVTDDGIQIWPYQQSPEWSNPDQ